MKTFLRIIIPVVSLLILLLCLWAAFVNEGKFEPAGILKGGIPMYFVAKGLFCSSMLFVLGRVLLLMLSRSGNDSR